MERVYVVIERMLKENENYEMILDYANVCGVFSTQENAVDFIRDYFKRSKIEDCKLSITESKNGDLYAKVVENHRIDNVPHRFVLSTCFFVPDSPTDPFADQGDSYYN